MTGRREDLRTRLAWSTVGTAFLAGTGLRGRVRLPGLTVLSDPESVRDVLAHGQFDRIAAHTTGARVAAEVGGDSLFAGEGARHRAVRSALRTRLSAVLADRPWQDELTRAGQSLRSGDTVDVPGVALRAAGAMTTALLGVDADPLRYAAAAVDVTAHAVRQEVPGLHTPPRPNAQRAYLHDRLTAADTGLLGDLRALGIPAQDRLATGTVLTLAATATTYTAMPRLLAWAAYDGLLPDDDPSTLVTGLLARIAPTLALPRRLATTCQTSDGPLSGLLLLNVSAAARPGRPRPRVSAAEATGLVFGHGPHACPGAGVARAMLEDLVVAFGPARPRVVRAVPAYWSAFPAWAQLAVTGTRP